MLKIIDERVRFETTADYVEFEWVDRPGAGFLFPADENLTPLPPENPAAAESMLLCYTSDEVISKGGFRSRTSMWRPAVAECVCGEPVVLHRGCHVECEACGSLYNQSGQSLVTCYCLPGGRRYLESMGERIEEDY